MITHLLHTTRNPAAINDPGRAWSYPLDLHRATDIEAMEHIKKAIRQASEARMLGITRFQAGATAMHLLLDGPTWCNGMHFDIEET